MKTTSFLLAIMGTLIILSCCNSNKENNSQVSARIKGEISISGAFALYPLTVIWAEEFKKNYPEVRIDISAGGAGKGMTDALTGIVDLGMFSREVSSIEEEKGAWKIAVAKDAVLATCNEKNSNLSRIHVNGLSKTALIELFLSEKTHRWKDCLAGGNDNKVNVYTRSDACGAAQMWGQYLGANQESLQGLGVFGDPGMADAIKKDIHGIGYNNVIYIYDIRTRQKYPGLEVIPIDLNNDGQINPDEDFYESLDSVMSAIKNNIYPSPPARELYFVSKGPPQKELVKRFIEWILTEGQSFVSQAGYVKLSDEKIKQEINRLQ